MLRTHVDRSDNDPGDDHDFATNESTGMANLWIGNRFHRGCDMRVSHSGLWPQAPWSGFSPAMERLRLAAATGVEASRAISRGRHIDGLYDPYRSSDGGDAAFGQRVGPELREQASPGVAWHRFILSLGCGSTGAFKTERGSRLAGHASYCVELYADNLSGRCSSDGDIDRLVGADGKDVFSGWCVHFAEYAPCCQRSVFTLSGSAILCGGHALCERLMCAEAKRRAHMGNDDRSI